MYYYRCIVTPKYICIFVLSSLRVASDWNFEIMKISLPIKLPWTLPFCPKRFQNRCSGEHNQNYDHIRTANWKNKKVAVQILLGQEAVWRLPLGESNVTKTMLFSPGFVWVFWKTTMIKFKVVMYTTGDCIHFVSIPLF